MAVETFDVKISQSPLDENQVLKTAFDDAESGGLGAIRTETVNGLVPPVYDYVGVTYPNATTVVYAFKVGGSSGTLQGTITLVYTDSTQADLSSATRS